MDKKQINVVFMGNFAYPDGMADSKRIQSFMEYLVGKGASTNLILLRQGGQKVKKPKQNGYYKGIKYITIGNEIDKDLRTIYTIPIYFIQGIAAISNYKKIQAKNILYCYNGMSFENIVFIIVAKMMGYYIVLDIVEDNTFVQERLHLLAKFKWVSTEVLERYTAKFADAVVVISHYLKDIYDKSVGKTIPVCFIPISAKCLSEGKSHSPQHPFKFVYSGSFAKKDGVELLIRAFDRISERHPDCVLLLTGKGANLPDIQKLISNHPAIRYVGYLEDNEFYNFLQQADILCVTRIGSTYANAGFPFKLGEYLATGNPVIVTNVSDVCLYLENMKDAIIIEPDNATAIQNAMEYCINNREEIKVIGKNGLSKCNQFFNPDANGLKLLELLHSL
ncbi:glycosyltransferase [Geobacter sp. AOG1]|uniref:glycosyltransferase n=1 Tax=Geobacter sp. AOG1 TaxID=1566346 RepID=UPI001CC61C91|nr:glycosyltransferase [Geobacter sp. AOG1]